MCGVLPARRDGHSQESVFAVGFPPVFLKNHLVFCHGCPNLPSGVVGYSGWWESGNILGFGVTFEFGAHIVGQ